MLLVLGAQVPSLLRKPRSYKSPSTGQKKKKTNKELPRALRYLDGMALTMPEARDRRVLAVLGVCPEELTSPFFLVRLQPRHEPPSLCQ